MNEKHQNKKDQPEKEELPGLQQMAVNPNPAANANIKDNLQKESKSEVEKAKIQSGSEITDGEGG